MLRDVKKTHAKNKVNSLPILGLIKWFIHMSEEWKIPIFLTFKLQILWILKMFIYILNIFIFCTRIISFNNNLWIEKLSCSKSLHWQWVIKYSYHFFSIAIPKILFFIESLIYQFICLIRFNLEKYIFWKWNQFPYYY